VVRKGDPIVELVDNDESLLERLGEERTAIQARRDAQAQKVETLRARIGSIRRSQRAEISAAESDVQIAQQGVEAADQELGAALAALETNDLNLARQVDLYDEGLASERELELAELAARQSKAMVASARAKFQAARNKLSQNRAYRARVVASTEAEIENAQASLQSAETDVATTNASLARLDVGISRQQAQTITAPTDGTILEASARSEQAPSTGGVWARPVATAALIEDNRIRTSLYQDADESTSYILARTIQNISNGETDPNLESDPFTLTVVRELVKRKLPKDKWLEIQSNERLVHELYLLLRDAGAQKRSAVAADQSLRRAADYSRG